MSAGRVSRHLGSLQFVLRLFLMLCRIFGLKAAGFCAIEGNVFFRTLAARLFVVRIADTPHHFNGLNGDDYRFICLYRIYHDGSWLIFVDYFQIIMKAAFLQKPRKYV